MFSFSLAMSISPGPVNMIILSSGVNYGVKKTVPYVSGATIGFTLLLLFIGLIFEQFVNAYPALLKYLAIFGSLYIVYMGYRIACAKPEIVIKKQVIPKFHQGFILQWLNPKAWLACVSGASIFSSVDSYTPFLTFVSIYFLVCYLSLLAWAVLGDKISFFLSSDIRLRIFNVLMGLLLVLTALMLIYQHV